MKYLFLLLMLPFTLSAQFNVDGPGNLNFTKVYEADLSKPAIKSAVNEWVAVNYNNANHVTSLDTDDKIIVNPLFTIHPVFQGHTAPLNIKYILSVEFREGRYRILLDNFLMGDYNSPIVNAEMPDFEEYKAEVKKSMASMPESSKKEMERILKNDKRARKMYDEGVGYQKQILEAVKTHVEHRIVNDLTAFVATKSEEPDW